MTAEPRTDGRGPSPEPQARLRLNLRRHRMVGKDFSRAYSEGSRAKSSLMTVVVRENGLEQRRFGLSVGKRCWKSAVKRNRVRRVFREAFRLSLPDLPDGIDVIMIASTPGAWPPLEETREQMTMLILKALRRYHEKRAKLKEVAK